MNARYVFLDLETTGLDAEVDEITEAAWILDDGTERQFIVAHHRLPNEWVLRNTDYMTRIALAEKKSFLDDVRFQLTTDCAVMKSEGTMRRVKRETALGVVDVGVPTGEPPNDLYLVGACPAFDDRFLRKAYGAGNPPYHYHVIDIEAMAMGALGHDAPMPLKHLRAALGLSGQNDAPHTALADAREVKLIWDALRARGAA